MPMQEGATLAVDAKPAADGVVLDAVVKPTARQQQPVHQVQPDSGEEHDIRQAESAGEVVAESVILGIDGNAETAAPGTDEVTAAESPSASPGGTSPAGGPQQQQQQRPQFELPAAAPVPNNNSQPGQLLTSPKSSRELAQGSVPAKPALKSQNSASRGAGTNDTFRGISWQDFYGQELTHVLEFEPSEHEEPEVDDVRQHKACCIIS